jgi:hypothetical protein
MADTWTEAVNNFTYYPDRDVSTTRWAPITFLGGWNRDGNAESPHQKELALAVCAENTDCWGVLGVNPGDKSRAGGWTYYLFGSAMGKTSNGGPEPGVSKYNCCKGRRMWIKKPGTIQPSKYKAGIGIVPQNGDTKVKICTDANGQQNCAGVGRGFWPRNMPNAGSAWSVVVPLGYKAGLNLNVFDGTDEADSQGDGSRVGSCGNLTSDGGNKVWNDSNVPGVCFRNGWNPGNRPDGIIVTQVPINLDDQNVFNNMESMGIGPSDARQMRNDYCAQKSQIDQQKCKAWFDNTAKSGTTWNTMKMGVCAGYDWGADTTCVNAANQIFKTGQSGEQSTASSLVNAYCNDKSKPACACVNATKRTIDQCLAEPTTPGCDTIATKVGKYKTLGAQFLTAQLKPFCASDECQNASSSTQGKYLSQPGPIGGCNDKINACFQQISVGQMSGGNLAVGCQIQDVNPPPPPPPPPAAKPANLPPPGAPAATTPPPSAPPPAQGSSNPAPASKPSAAAAGSSDLLWSASAVPGLDTKDKQLFGVGFCCLCMLCCCALLFVLAMSSQGGGGGGSGAYSQMLMARLR